MRGGTTHVRVVQLGEQERFSTRVARSPLAVVLGRLDRDRTSLTTAEHIEGAFVSQVGEEDGPALARPDGRGVDRDGSTLQRPGGEEGGWHVAVVVGS